MDQQDPAPPAATVMPLLLSSTTTPLLRRCTALAARARVDLVSGGRHAAADELIGVLRQIDAWGEAEIVDPDPTMLALGIAALQDLVERLPEGSLLPPLGLVHDVLDQLRSRLAATAASFSA